MRRSSDSTTRRAQGFTLLEMALTMLIVSLLMAAIFAIVGSTSELADGMQRDQDRDGQRHSFAQFCERTLRSLPPNGFVRLKVKQSGNHYLSELALKNAPAAFSGSGANGVTILETEEQTNGYLRVVLKYLSAEDASAADSGKADVSKQQRLVLIENVAKCEWKFYDARSQQWVTLWNEKMPLGTGREFPYPVEFEAPRIPQNPKPDQPGAAPPPPPPTPVSNGLRPGLIELTLAVAGDMEQRFVFWMPPAETPRLAAAAPPPGVPGTNPDGTPINPPPNPSNGTNPQVSIPVPAQAR